MTRLMAVRIPLKRQNFFCCEVEYTASADVVAAEMLAVLSYTFCICVSSAVLTGRKQPVFVLQNHAKRQWSTRGFPSFDENTNTIANQHTLRSDIWRLSWLRTPLLIIKKASAFAQASVEADVRLLLFL
jgi:hypothetical protein